MKKILVVDDEVEIRKLLDDFFTSEGFEVVAVDNGEEAVAKVEKEDFAAVLLDIILPGIDGIEVLRRIRSIKSELPIIIMTAKGTHRNALEALKLGALNLIAKPFGLNEILKIVKDSLSGEKATVPGTTLSKEIYLTTLKTLVRTLEAKDFYTKEHSSRVAAYAVALAEEMELPAEQIEVIENASLIHDIGKIAISDLLLHKKESLNNEDWIIVKQHPRVGKEIIDPSLLLHIEQPAILYHHERFDGKGYPDGLKGKEIPLAARILTVADAYAAMTSERPYRHALSQEEAVEELKKNSGTQFDPAIIEMFLRLLKRKLAKK